jgi:hypothetical protein
VEPERLIKVLPVVLVLEIAQLTVKVVVVVVELPLLDKQLLLTRQVPAVMEFLQVLLDLLPRELVVVAVELLLPLVVLVELVAVALVTQLQAQQTLVAVEEERLTQPQPVVMVEVV